MYMFTVSFIALTAAVKTRTIGTSMQYLGVEYALITSSRYQIVQAPNLSKWVWLMLQNRSHPWSRDFQICCRECIGIYYGKLAPADPNIKQKSNANQTQRMRRMCFACRTATDYYGLGCHGYLCFL
jgi:hypothetical protein